MPVQYYNKIPYIKGYPVMHLTLDRNKDKRFNWISLLQLLTK